jgi:aquaporin NIP
MKREFFAEIIGTFALVFCGTGAVMSNEIFDGALGNIGIAVTFGFVVIAVIYAFGHISGAHINPAVSIAFWAAKRFEAKKLLIYIPAQLIGATLASLTLSVLFKDFQTSFGVTTPSINVWSAFIFEVLLSFLLMLVILNVSSGAHEQGLMAGIAIGGTVLLEAMFAGPATGASMNPARSFAPALVSGELSYLWIYLTAPVIGMLLASPLCKFFNGPQCCN